MSISKTTTKKKTVVPREQRSYNDIVAYLDQHWTTGDQQSTLTRMAQLDQALGHIAKKTPAILIAGSNGKSLTAHFTTKLLQEEGLTVGACLSPHILTYNERIALNQQAVSNKDFTDLANQVIAAAEELTIQVNSAEVLTMMSLLYFKKKEVDVALLEVHEGGALHPANICDAKVATVTRVTSLQAQENEDELLASLREMMGIVKKETHFVSGDQSKAHLQLMQDITKEHAGVWIMPIRKLAPLAYPFEQLHGRCAALAERLAAVFVNNFAAKNAFVLEDSLLVKQKGQRGRPTLEAKRQAELHPKKTVEQFWKETTSSLPNRFHILDKEKPTILLDTADNIDAFSNLLLGIRLLHYQRPLKGLTIIVAASDKTLHCEEFLKLVRYFFKKTSGQLFVCPIKHALPGNHEENSWDAETVTNDFKAMKVKAQAFSSFQAAFKKAKDSVDERDGLIVVTGSQSIVSEYWKNKGIKKLG